MRTNNARHAEKAREHVRADIVARKVLGHRKYQTTQQHDIRISAEEAARLALQMVRGGAPL